VSARGEMAYSFRFLKLFMSEINQLGDLRRVVTNLHTASLVEKPQIMRKIDALMYEIALSNRTIRDYKSSYLQSVNS
jgi:phage host-nuclease inhibitor protein Gam